jgi:hypothetical protein
MRQSKKVAARSHVTDDEYLGVARCGDDHDDGDGDGGGGGDGFLCSVSYLCCQQSIGLVGRIVEEQAVVT